MNLLRFLSICALATTSFGQSACSGHDAKLAGDGEAPNLGAPGAGGSAAGSWGARDGSSGHVRDLSNAQVADELVLTNTGADVCPGDAYSLANGESLVLMGDTSGAADDYNPTCDEGDGNDLVYAITFNDPGTLDLSLYSLGGALDPVLSLRTGCDAAETAMFCRNSSALARGYRVDVAPGTYYVFVDGAGATSGEFRLSLKVDAPACGDGAVNPGEQCDDGNTASLDGCDASCAAEPGADFNCGNAPDADVFAAAPLSLHGNTFGSTMTNDYNHISDPNCADVEGGGPDHVYKITAQSAGDLHLRLGFNPDFPSSPDSDCDVDELGVRCWVRTMYVRTTCEDANSQVACFGPGGDADGPGGVPDYVEEIVLPSVQIGETYYVFVDSYWDGQTGAACGDNCVSGPYTLHISYD
jgi:cysteine-rich repeat protein